MRVLILFSVLVFSSFLACGKTDQSDKTQAELSAVHPTVSWIQACRVQDEGFGCFPGDSSFTTRTGMALEALSVLSALDKIEDREKLVAWIQSRDFAHGGPRWADLVSAVAAYAILAGGLAAGLAWRRRKSS